MQRGRGKGEGRDSVSPEEFQKLMIDRGRPDASMQFFSVLQSVELKFFEQPCRSQVGHLNKYRCHPRMTLHVKTYVCSGSDAQSHQTPALWMLGVSNQVSSENLKQVAQWKIVVFAGKGVCVPFTTLV